MSATEAASSDLRTLARGGLINLVGAGGSAVFTFAAFVLAARLHTTAQVGAFTVAIAVFTILRQVAVSGAQIGFMRFLAADIERDRRDRLGPTLRAGLPVVAVVGVIAAVLAIVAGETLAELLGSDADGVLVARHLRWLGPVVPLASMLLALAFATQGLGTMVPAAATEKLAVPALQLAGVALTGVVGARWLGAAWAIPFVLVLPVLALWLRRLLHDVGGLRTDVTVDRAEVRRRFWSFSAPRGVASALQVAVQWGDTILIGILASTADAGVYSIATRYLVVGSLVISAVQQVTGPRYAGLVERGAIGELQAIFRTSARWVIWLVWPAYLTLATLPEPMLRLFGEDYVRAASSLAVVAIATSLSAASGSVDTLLLMAGRSRLSLANWTVALVVDLALAVVLIPRFGILGAAIAWSVAIIVRNLLPLVQLRRILGVDPFGPGWLRAVLTATALFGGGGLLARLLLGPTLAAVVATVVVAGALHAALALHWREHLVVRHTPEPTP